MKKRIRQYTLLICLVLVTLGNTFYVEAAVGTDVIQPYYTYILSAANELEITGDQALMDTQIAAKKSSNLSITMKLQKKSGTTWTTVNTWSTSKEGVYSLSLSKTYTISSGTYRLYSTVSAGDETKVLISNSQTR